MRIFSILIFFLVLVNFTGIPELVSGLCDDNSALTAQQDEMDGKESEVNKNEKEKDDLKDGILSENIFCCVINAGPSLEIHNGILRDSGFYPEDHFPPPERT
jgi:hypothetical protein